MTIHTLTSTTRPYFILEGAHTAYAFGLNPAGRLAHSYWGPRLPYTQDYPSPPDPAPWASFDSAAHLTPEEFPAYSGMKFTEPCLKATFADGVRDVVLHFDTARAEGDELAVSLCDAHYPLRLMLHYRVHPVYDLIERWATLHNDGDQPVELERAFSAQWHLPERHGYRLTHLTGRWLDEMHIRQETLNYGTKVLESRRLTTSHHHSPFFMLDGGTADEDSGEVWFGTLAWSGNWKQIAEVADYGAARISIGVNDWDFTWRLAPGESFSTPPALAGYTRGGFGAASRALHDYVREHVLPHGSSTHKILYNSWEATFFDVDEESQAALAHSAAAIGVELFVMDDGWFKGRRLDNAGLGDWIPDPGKFPNGLGPLIRRVNALGMEFGLWVEPEMVNRDSDLYRAHPDWVIAFPTRERTEARQQMILNLGRADVQEYILASLDTLLREHNIRFIKWDMNRNVSEPGWPDAPGDARELWVRHVYGLYHVWGTLRERYPNVIWQSCSGGGGRADLGILRFADQVWPSDNTDATARLAIQEGFSYLFPANVMEAWVTDVGADRLPLAFRFHVSMCGVLGIGCHLLRWTQKERDEAAALIALYKTIRPIVQLGDQYRLLSAQRGACSAVQYVSKDKREAVLFAFRTQVPPPFRFPRLYLRGLEETALYRLEGCAEVRSGLSWMQAGVQFALDNFESTVRRITRLD